MEPDLPRVHCWHHSRTVLTHVYFVDASSVLYCTDPCVHCCHNSRTVLTHVYTVDTSSVLYWPMCTLLTPQPYCTDFWLLLQAFSWDQMGLWATCDGDSCHWAFFEDRGSLLGPGMPGEGESCYMLHLLASGQLILLKF